MYSSTVAAIHLVLPRLDIYRDTFHPMSQPLPKPFEDDAIDSLLDGAALASYRHHLKSLAIVIRGNPPSAEALMLL